MAKFGEGLAMVAKVNNHKKGRGVKIALRRQLVEAIPGPLSVLDCFAGSGVMFSEAWFDVADYCGCDTQWEPWFRHKAYCADNCRVLRHIDLDAFNIFDLDAYGSPWEQAAIIAARRKLKPGELVGVALTDGSAMRARLGAVDWKMAAMAGVAPSMRGAHREWSAITGRALTEMARRMGGTVAQVWQGEPDGRAMLYSSAVFRGAA